MPPGFDHAEEDGGRPSGASVAPPFTCRKCNSRGAHKPRTFPRAGRGSAAGTRLAISLNMAFAIEKNLLNRALEGDPASLNALVGSLRPHVEKQLLRYPVADEDRRDLLQATLMQVVRRLGSFRGESSFSTWLFRVTANEALMMMRSQRRHRARLVAGLDFEELGSLPAANDSAAADRCDTRASNHERDELVRSAVAELPEDYRNVVFAHYHLDLGLQEIADKFDLSESAVRSRLHRARSRLRSILGEAPQAAEWDLAPAPQPPASERRRKVSAVAAA